MTLRTRTDALLLAGFCTFLFFYGIGQFGLIGADEPRYAQVAREMLDRHDWITPTLGGRPWLEKPPLYYWQAMLVFSVFGVSDSAARIPSAFDATLLVISIYLFFRKFRHAGEVDAALMTASCAGIIGYARAASMDMALTSVFAIGMLAWWGWRETAKRTYLAFFFILMALGTLAKGPVAPFLAVLIILLFCAMTCEWRVLKATAWPLGLLLYVAVALPWFLAVQLRNPQFFREFILEHNLARFSTNLYHHPEPIWYYLPVTALALIPWIVFVTTSFVQTMRAWWAERKSRQHDADLEFQFGLFCCCWLVVPIIFFSISQSKLPGYILPAVSAGAALLAQYLLQRSDEDQPVSRWLAILHAIVAAAPVVPAVLIGFAVTEHRLPSGRPMLFAIAVALVLSVGIAVSLVSRLHLRMLRFVTLIPVVLAVAAVLKLGTTEIDQKLSVRPLANEIDSVETHKLPLAVFGVQREVEYGLAFYRNQVISRYDSGDIPVGEHLLVAPTTWMDNVAKQTAGRRVSFLGHYGPQGLDYYWVAAAGVKP